MLLIPSFKNLIQIHTENNGRKKNSGCNAGILAPGDNDFISMTRK